MSDLTFSVKAGTTVALVGTTGAGKSTAMALLHRLADPQDGVIRIDGADIRDVTLNSLRHNIGVVFQDSTMFYRTIAENLRVGRPEATDAELVEAAKLAEAHDFILRQPKGYDTALGERGITLSGGERQRIAIARALLKDPPILILDEATSALDAATESRVQKALKVLMKGRTTFIIAHRLSTVREADVILVFRGGRIVERGGYRELIARDGIFAELVRMQLGDGRGQGRRLPPAAALGGLPPLIGPELPADQNGRRGTVDETSGQRLALVAPRAPWPNQRWSLPPPAFLPGTMQNSRTQNGSNRA